VSHRPLATVTGLTIGDYLLWNWSLNTNHDVLALVSGLTLPPLTIACVWLLALTAARLIARRSRARGRAQRATAQRPRVSAAAEQAPAPARAVSPSATSARRSRKIAA
jgi:branched-subunit amino acid ABC-type transport system permease component